MLCVNMVFRCGNTVDENIIIRYLEGKKFDNAIREKLKGLEDFISFKGKKIKDDLILRVVDATNLKIDFFKLEKILEKISKNSDIDEVKNIYFYECSAKEDSKKLSSFIDTIKNEVKDDYFLFIKDKDEVSKNKIDSLYLRASTYLKKERVFLVNSYEKNIVKIAENIAGISYLNYKFEEYKNELDIIFDEYIVKTIYMIINKIKLQNRNKIFDKKEDDISDFEMLNIKKDYLKEIDYELEIIEKAFDKEIAKINSKFDLNLEKFEILKYNFKEEIETDESKISKLYEELLKKDNEKEVKIFKKFKKDKEVIQTNTEEIEKYLIIEGLKYKMSIKNSIRAYKIKEILKKE
ncbi:hypothetical protein [Clostridium chrysemydis]|uniref:hypothetical protein n=1 Tax=Clostridium chrysemydis TaxID=2665504 RepID=UPI00188384A6|nr:hypothetical protein [Clostridium chrysemydis]